MMASVSTQDPAAEGKKKRDAAADNFDQEAWAVQELSGNRRRVTAPLHADLRGKRSRQDHDVRDPTIPVHEYASYFHRPQDARHGWQS